jgi:hypothetical protein
MSRRDKLSGDGNAWTTEIVCYAWSRGLCDGTRGGDDEGWGAEKAGVQMFATVSGRGFKYSV